jgi:exonuclease SbcC
VQDEGNAMDIFISYGDSRRLLELGSGMEKFVSCIAIRVALTTVSSLPKTDIFIIDEGFGSLDDVGIEACGRLLQSLKRYFRNVIVISHVDGIKDVADNIIEISRNERDSMVSVP